MGWLKVRISYTYSQFLDGIFAGCAGSGNLYKVLRVGALEVSRILRFSDLVVRTRSRELDLCAGATLKIVKVLSITSNQSLVLNVRNINHQNHTVTKFSSNLFQLCLYLLDQSRFTAEANFIGRLRLVGAGTRS